MSKKSTVKQPKDQIRGIGRLFAWVSATMCLLPLVLVFAVSTSEVWQRGPWAGGFTLKYLAQGWQTISPYAWFSIKLALLVLLLNFIIGIPTSWVLARHRFPGRDLLFSLTNVPIAACVDHHLSSIKAKWFLTGGRSSTVYVAVFHWISYPSTEPAFSKGCGMGGCYTRCKLSQTSYVCDFSENPNQLARSHYHGCHSFNG